MKAFYEEYRDDDENLDVRRNGFYLFPPHFHRNIEILIVNQGAYTVVHNGVSYSVKDGDIFFCGSYDLHSYGTPEGKEQDDCCVIIPARLTSSFNERNKGLRPVSPVIREPALCAELLNIADRWMDKEKNPDAVRGAAANLLLSLIEQKLELRPGKEKDETQLIRKILTYLSANFREDISLPFLAKKFGYTEAHVSRVFHRYTETGLPRYLNRLRLNYVETCKKNDPNADLTRVIFDAGFKSIPTYYRAKAQDAPLSTHTRNGSGKIQRD